MEESKGLLSEDVPVYGANLQSDQELLTQLTGSDEAAGSSGEEREAGGEPMEDLEHVIAACEGGELSGRDSDEEVELDESDIRSYYKKKRKRHLWDYVTALDRLKWLLLALFLLNIGLLCLYIFSDDWRAMPGKGWMAVLITCFTLFFLISNLYPPAFVFLASMALCYGLTLVDSDGAFEGFSNTGVLTVGVMFMVAKAVELSDVLRYVVKYLLRQPKSLAIAQLRLCVPVAVVSAFINNTPVVAMMIPVVQNWAVQCRLPVPRLMMPLSYAAIAGGTCTIIGTSTNLIVEGLATSADPDLTIGFFEVGYVGVPVAIFTMAYMLVASRFLLPGKHMDISKSVPALVASQESSENFHDHAPSQRKMYTCSVLVTSLTPLQSSGLIGHTVESAGLSMLEGLTLLKVAKREEQPDEADVELLEAEAEVKAHLAGDGLEVDPETPIESGDILFFYGMLRHVYVVYTLDGCVPATTQIAKMSGKRHNRVMVEVVVSPSAQFTGKTVRQSAFRSKYNAVIIAAYRFNERMTKRIGDITLKGGDTLLLEATTDFLKYHTSDPDFALVHEVSAKSTTPRRVSFNMFIVLFLAAIMVTLAALQVYGILPGALLVVCLYVVLGCMTWRQAMDSLQGDTLMVIATAFGLGNSLQATGAAAIISNTLINIFYKTAGDIGVLFGLYMATAVLSAVISNGATVTLMFPIAVGFLDQTTLTMESVTFTLMLAASCCFSTPVGYQTNLMVLGPGGYTTADFLKFGVPLTIMNMCISVCMVYLIWN